jgi:hypothetical protein
MEVGDQIHTPAALPPGKKPGTHLHMRGCGPQSQARRFGHDKNLNVPAGMGNPDRPARDLVRVPTTLPRVPKLHKYLFSFVNNIGHEIVNTN